MFTIRPMLATEFPLVLDSWHRSYAQRSKMPNRERRAHMDDIRRVLLLETTVCEVVVHEQSPEVVLGYVVFDEQRALVHWIYVKAKFRDKYDLAGKLLGVVTERIGHDQIGYTQATAKVHSKAYPGFYHRKGEVCESSNYAPRRQEGNSGGAH